MVVGPAPISADAATTKTVGVGKTITYNAKATVRAGHGTTDRFQIGKGVRQGCILSPAYLIYMQSTS